MTKSAKATSRRVLAAVVRKEGSEGAVAKKLKCSQQAVSAWVRGTNDPRKDMQKKLKRVYGVPLWSEA